MNAPGSIRMKPKSTTKKKSWRKKGTGKYYDTIGWRLDRLNHLHANPLCVKCKKKGFTTEATVSDHITPVNQGGDMWDWNNRQALCASCHNKKTAKESQEYRKK